MGKKQSGLFIFDEATCLEERKNLNSKSALYFLASDSSMLLVPYYPVQLVACYLDRKWSLACNSSIAVKDGDSDDRIGYRRGDRHC